MNYQELIKRANKNNFDAIEVTENTTKSMNIAIFNGKVDKNEISEITNISIRAIINGKMSYLTLENENEDLDNVLQSLRENANILTTDEQFEIFSGSEEYPKVEETPIDFDDFTMLDNINLLKELENNVKNADNRIIYVSFCEYEQELNTMRIVNSKGLDLTKSNHYSLVAIQAVASENGKTCSGFSIDAKVKRADINPKAICDDVVRKTVSMLNAKPIKSSIYPVIIENETMIDLFATFQSMFSGEAAIRGITPYVGKENTLIMSDKITIIDDPLMRGVGVLETQPFDDEGVACYSKKIVDNGVFKTMLHNLKTAKYFNTTSTGNGFKAANGIIARGHNMYIENGCISKDDMIKSIEKGLLITDLDGLHAGVDVVSGDFSLKASGYYIENGEISRAVTLIVIAGNFYKLLKEEVEAIGNDFKMKYNAIGAPSIKFSHIAVSGE